LTTKPRKRRALLRFYYFINAQRRKRERKTGANAGGDTRKIQIRRNPRRRSTIADETRFFFVSVASVAFSRQKAGNASDANRKTAQSSRKFALKKENGNLS
jgi:hypothetical protein